LRELCTTEEMYAYIFQGRRYDVGSKIGFIEATVDYALKSDELREDFKKYLKSINLE